MANALKGKTTVSITYIAPTKEGVDALNIFLIVTMNLWKPRVTVKAL